ncbi:MAG: T9SS type A sorting domain-containing protein [Rhodothermales bacterium]
MCLSARFLPLVLLNAFFLAAALPGFAVQAQVCQGSFELDTQAEVDAFDCAEVTGNLMIGGVVSSIDSLHSLVSVGGTLRLSSRGGLNDLAGLGALVSAGTLFITHNESLVHLNGLTSLSEVGNIHISGNEELLDVAGLLALTYVEGDVVIAGNDVLSTLEGLAGLTSVGGLLSINRSNALSDLDGLHNIVSVGSLTVYESENLTNLRGLGALASVGEAAYIYNNDALADLGGLNNLIAVEGLLEISYNSALYSLQGLESLLSIGELVIEGNGVLTNLEGLDALASTDDNLIITGNGALTDLDNLNGLTAIGGRLQINANDALPHLDGLANLIAVAEGLRVFSNNVLSSCTVGLYDLLANDGVGGDIDISNNATGCNSVEEILNSVDAEDEATPAVTALAAPFPNPTAGTTTLAFTLAELADVRLTVYDALGRRVATLADGPHASGTHEAAWGAGLPAGTYVVRFETSEEAWTERVTLVR